VDEFGKVGKSNRIPSEVWSFPGKVAAGTCLLARGGYYGGHIQDVLRLLDMVNSSTRFEPRHSPSPGRVRAM
jgi:hypothetical protein